MNISYIYNTSGQAEYAVIPMLLWQELSRSLGNEKIAASNPKPPMFNPRNFKGLLNGLNLDVDVEISNMRNEWTRNI